MPYLELQNDLTFFSANAAICYFLPPTEDIASKVYDWLEWEATVLSPTLAQIGKLGRDIQLKPDVEKCLNFLNVELGTRSFLVQVNNIVFCSSFLNEKFEYKINRYLLNS